MSRGGVFAPIVKNCAESDVRVGLDSVLKCPRVPSLDAIKQEQVLRRPSSREEAQSLARELHQMALELEARELGRLDTVRQRSSGNPLLFCLVLMCVCFYHFLPPAQLVLYYIRI